MILYKENLPGNEEEIISLYKSVCWTRYVDHPELLIKALNHSSYIISAYDGGKLIALIRGLSDGVSINFIQDILVLPEYQRKGIGRQLLNKVLAKYPSIHKVVLLTDDDSSQKAFYEDCGLQNLSECVPVLNCYLQLK